MTVEVGVDPQGLLDTVRAIEEQLGGYRRRMSDYAPRISA